MSRETLEGIVYEYTMELGKDLVDDLPEAEQDIVNRYFGIFPYQPHSTRQLGICYNISKNGAWKRLRIVLAKLRKLYRKKSFRLTKSNG